MVSRLFAFDWAPRNSVSYLVALDTDSVREVGLFASRASFFAVLAKWLGAGCLLSRVFGIAQAPLRRRIVIPRRASAPVCGYEPSTQHGV